MTKFSFLKHHWQVILLLWTPNLWASSLLEIYQKSLERSEQHLMSQESLYQAEAEYSKALGESLPEVYLGHQMSWFDQKGNLVDVDRPQYETKIGVRKSLFNGFKEYLALKAADKFQKQKEYELQQAKNNLAIELSTYYFNWQIALARLQTLNALNESLDKQRVKIRQYVQQGRVRRSELLNIDTKIQANDIEKLKIQRQIDASLRLLKSLSHIDLKVKTIDTPKVLTLQDLSWYLKKLASNPRLQSLDLATELYKTNLRVERTKHLPNVNLSANYYLDKNDRSPSDWDAVLSVDMPVWSWGKTAAGIRSQHANYRKQYLNQREVERNLHEEVSQLHAALVGQVEELTILSKSLKTVQSELSLTQRDYASGLITLNELLEVHNRKSQIENDLAITQFEKQLDRIKLDLLCGYKPEEVLR